MSTATLEVNKQSIRHFLGQENQSCFVIPEYQREYAWEDDQVNQLFDDIWEFIQQKGLLENSTKDTYFLGCIVGYLNEKEEMEIIDGQQRLTTLFLLLCAIYTKLERGTDTPKSLYAKQKIAPLLWQTDPTTGSVIRDHVLLSSRVINEDANRTFKYIMQNGDIPEHISNKYTQNYQLLQQRVDTLAKDEPIGFFYYINALLDNIIFMPIISGDYDTALVIFLTLNDRGMQLSDADIFKAKIYNQLPVAKREEFIEAWRQLTEDVKDVDLDIQTLFTYHSFFCRAREEDKDTTRIAVRKYYSYDHFSRLQEPRLMDELQDILKFWRVVLRHEPIENERWSSNVNYYQIFDILREYANDFWRFTSVSYYMLHRDDSDFEENFLSFLRAVCAFLIKFYFYKPGVNALKSHLYNLNAAIKGSSRPRISFIDIDLNELKGKMTEPNAKVIRMLMALLAYDDDPSGLLPDKWDVEHIMPRKFDKAFFFPAEKVIEILDHIGNKLPLERKHNIQATNNFFSSKCGYYRNSKIKVAKDFAMQAPRQWTPQEVKQRDSIVINRILSRLDTWQHGYTQVGAIVQPAPVQSAPVQPAPVQPASAPVTPNNELTPKDCLLDALDCYKLKLEDELLKQTISIPNTERTSLSRYPGVGGKKSPYQNLRVVWDDGQKWQMEKAKETYMRVLHHVGGAFLFEVSQKYHIPNWPLIVRKNQNASSMFRPKDLGIEYRVETNRSVESLAKELEAVANVLAKLGKPSFRVEILEN